MVKREQFTPVFYAISIYYQGVGRLAKQILNTSTTYTFNCFAPMFIMCTSWAEMGMYFPVGSIQSSAGKGLYGWASDCFADN